MKKVMAVCLSVIFLVSGIVVSYAENSITVEPNNVNPISAKQGQFVITFDSAEAAAEMLDDIDFKDRKNKTIKGGIWAEINTNNLKQIIAKYGALENNNTYTLTIGDASFEYTTEDYLFYEDFSDTELYPRGALAIPESATVSTVTTAASADGRGGEEVQMWTYTIGGIRYYHIKDDGTKFETREANNDRYIRATNSNVYRNDVEAFIDFPANGTNYLLDENVYQVLKVRPMNSDGGENRPRVLQVRFGNNDEIRMLDMQKAVVERSISAIGEADGMKGPLTAANSAFSTDSKYLDENGFYDIGFLYSRGTDNKYIVRITNLNKPDEYIEYRSPAITRGIKYLRIMHNGAWDGTGECYLDLSQVSVESVSKTDILYTDIDKNEARYRVVFDNDIVEETAETLVVKDANDNVVKTTFESYDPDSRTATYLLNEYLDAGSQYSIALDGVIDCYRGKMKSNSYVFNVDSSKTTVILEDNLSLSGDAATATMKIKNVSNEEIDYYLAIVVYDNNGRIVSMSAVDRETLLSSAETVLQASTEGIEIKEGYQVKRVAWRIGKTEAAIDKDAVSIAPIKVADK